MTKPFKTQHWWTPEGMVISPPKDGPAWYPHEAHFEERKELRLMLEEARVALDAAGNKKAAQRIWTYLMTGRRP